MAASPSDTAADWTELLRRLPRAPELVVYDSDKSVAEVVPKLWPTAHLHLCEHRLYVNGRKRLEKDGQGASGNVYGALLADAGRSATGWSAFRNAVFADSSLVKTRKWVLHWVEQMTGQTARRPSMPPYYSTGALDPHFAVLRQTLKPRAWTCRNLARMNLLLGLTRLRVNLRDAPGDWAKLIAERLEGRPYLPSLDEPVHVTEDGSRTYSLRMHPVPQRAQSKA